MRSAHLQSISITMRSAHLQSKLPWKLLDFAQITSQLHVHSHRFPHSKTSNCFFHVKFGWQIVHNITPFETPKSETRQQRNRNLLCMESSMLQRERRSKEGCEWWLITSTPGVMKKINDMKWGILAQPRPEELHVFETWLVLHWNQI
jgi:hypothetical protein